MINKSVQLIDFQTALDNLAVVASINLESPPPLGILKKYQFVISDEALEEGAVQWLSAEGPEPILEVMELTYRTVLDELYKIADEEWEHRERISAAMALAGEAAKILNRYLEYRFGRPLELKIEERPAYKELQELYREKFLPVESPFAIPQGTGFKDFEAVKQDAEYELFYIRNEEGLPYFDAEMLRNIKLTVDFQTEEDSFEEDPLLKVRAMQDRDLHAAAGQILTLCEPQIFEFYRHYKKVQDNDLAKKLGMALISLFVANNPRYLIQNTTGKSCINYYNDFLSFLRAAMQTPDYQKLIAYPPDKSNKLIHNLLQLTHALCRALYFRTDGIKQEAIGLIHRSMRRGEEMSKKGLKGDTIWNQFQIDDEKLRSLLAKFPNGPLFKVLDLIRVEQEEDVHIAFDPTGQENFPSKLFNLQMQSRPVAVLRMPSPTRQAFIHKAEIIDEFRGFLRAMAGEKRHLLINLQDRNSWKEGVRCRILEGLQKRVEFAPQFSILTLPKDSAFYNQSGTFAEQSKAAEFIKAFEAQIVNGEENGFYLPQIDKAIPWDSFFRAIHRTYFEGKSAPARC